MDKLVDARFERVEKALASLIDSITKFNPSTSIAKDLLTADTELTKGLEEVECHQSNYLRLQQLRAAADANDRSIRETFRTLTSARRDLKSTPTTTFPDKLSYPIKYDELLAYARRISKTTLPPPGVTNGVVFHPPESQAGDLTGANGTPAFGSTAQTPLPMSQAQSPAPGISQLPSELPTQTTLGSVSNISLPEGLTQHLNPLTGAMFFPWPLEDKVRGGALTSLQQLHDQGIDSKGYDPVEEERQRIKAEEERREREERERIQREEEERRMREERERKRQEMDRARESEQMEIFRRGSVVVGPGATGPASALPRSSTSGPGEKRQFQFTSIEDEDDDEDGDD